MNRDITATRLWAAVIASKTSLTLTTSCKNQPASRQHKLTAQVVRMNSWCKALLLGSCVFASTTFAGTSDVTLTWDNVEHADRYRLEQRLSSSSTWEVKYENAANSASLTGIADGSYVYRVIGCVINPAAPNTPLCEEVADYSAHYPLTFPLPNDSTQRRVIFIHTDLLGSPAAETDEQGVSL
jgi:hypothetical protein